MHPPADFGHEAAGIGPGLATLAEGLAPECGEEAPYARIVAARIFAGHVPNEPVLPIQRDPVRTAVMAAVARADGRPCVRCRRRTAGLQ